MVLVLMESLAGSGHKFATTRPKLGEKLDQMKFDPLGKCTWSQCSKKTWSWYYCSLKWMQLVNVNIDMHWRWCMQTHVSHYFDGKLHVPICKEQHCPIMWLSQQTLSFFCTFKFFAQTFVSNELFCLYFSSPVCDI